MYIGLLDEEGFLLAIASQSSCIFSTLYLVFSVVAMAEVIGIASGIVALTSFAFQSSVSLYQVVDSFKTNRKNIRALKDELEALEAVLKSLREATANSIIDIPALKLPLYRCGQACREFEAVIVKCTTHSGGTRTSFRDWAKLRYMGDDVLGFKEMLAGYKSTISIALADANLYVGRPLPVIGLSNNVCNSRRATITAEVVQEYKEMIANTTSDLEEHLQNIEEKLQGLLSGTDSNSDDDDVAERERIEAEKDSTKQCLAICAQVSEQVQQLRPNVFEDVSAPKDSHQVDVSSSGGLSAKRVTANVLQNFQETLTKTTSALEDHLLDIDEKLRHQSSPEARIWGTAERERVQEEINSTKQCLAICTKASEEAEQFRTNVLEDISAAQDAHQVIVATLGDLISAKRVTAELASAQWLGQMTDASLQQLSRDRALEIRSRASPNKLADDGMEPGASFADQYGAGYKLS